MCSVQHVGNFNKICLHAVNQNERQRRKDQLACTLDSSQTAPIGETFQAGSALIDKSGYTESGRVVLLTYVLDNAFEVGCSRR